MAFAGTVTAVQGGKVTLSVDTWYRAGDAAEVLLNAPPGMDALIGGIPFETGTQYLITAQGGNVNYCGFSGVASPEYQLSFNQASNHRRNEADPQENPAGRLQLANPSGGGSTCWESQSFVVDLRSQPVHR